MNTLAKHPRLRLVAASLLLASLAVRAMVPLGYMPGTIGNGEFMVLCPVQSAAAISLLPAPPAHDHGDAGETVASIGIACPIGSSLFFDAIPGLDYPLFATRQRFAVPPDVAAATCPESPDLPPVARGPPHS